MKSGNKAAALGGINKDRIPSRHEKQRQDNVPVDSNQAQYYLFGDKQGGAGSDYQHQ